MRSRSSVAAITALVTAATPFWFGSGEAGARQAPRDGSCTHAAATIVGTSGDDRLIGTPGDDIIWSAGGQDFIRGLEGDDILCGGRGHDRILGGAGEDRIVGSAGDDMMLGGRAPIDWVAVTALDR